MYASTMSAALVGVEPRPVKVEAHLGRGEGGFTLVGLPDTAVREAKERVRSAFASSGFRFPTSKVVVNLAPAALPKGGSAFDLPIALGVLAAARLIPQASAEVVAVGELALDGSLRPTGGALAAAIVAIRGGLPCVVPPGCAEEARLVEGADVRVVESLAEAAAASQSDAGLTSPSNVRPLPPMDDLSDVRGQTGARRALEVAAAGGHHLLMVGPPGCGKTMLARRLPGLLPLLTAEEQMEVACVHAAGHRHRGDHRIPPFRAPHHSATAAAVLGGGSGIPVPGELALAHRGVLFLDEMAEYPAHLLDALRQPLEDGSVTIARKGFTVRYPASAQVVAAANRCPCGFLGDRVRSCECGSAAVEKYRRRLSGPLVDRFDITIPVHRPGRLDRPPAESSAAVRERVKAARAHQLERGILNRELRTSDLDSLDMSGAGTAVLQRAVDGGAVTGRGFDRVRRVARTVADLAGADITDVDHVAEALSYRGKW